MPNNHALPPERDWTLEMLDRTTVEHGLEAATVMDSPYTARRLMVLAYPEYREEFRAYCREHRDEIRCGQRQAHHAIEMLFARHRRLMFRARDELARRNRAVAG